MTTEQKENKPILASIQLMEARIKATESLIKEFDKIGKYYA